MDHYVTIYARQEYDPKLYLVGAIPYPNPTNTDIQRALSRFRAMRLPVPCKFFAEVAENVGPTYVPVVIVPEYGNAN